MKQNSARAIRLDDLEATLERVGSRIAPIWPLDRFVAVNPLWGFVERPIAEAAATVATDAGIQLTMPRRWYRELWEEGRFGMRHIREAIQRTGAPLDAETVFSRMHVAAPPLRARKHVAAVADDLPGRGSWGSFVIEDLSRFCAVWFDRSAGGPPSPGLFTAWRDSTAADHTPSLFVGARSHRERVLRLPTTPESAIAGGLEALGVLPEQWEGYLTALLFDVLGWASWCAWHRWTARLEGGDDRSILELLAARLCWEVLIHASDPRIAEAWSEELEQWASEVDPDAVAARRADWVLQTAVELALHQRVAAGFTRSPGIAGDEPPTVQAAFCIDVRSEPLRSALERVDPRIRTLGFAGFFGLPMAYRPVGARTALPQLPAPLAPRLLAIDTNVPEPVARRRVQRLDLRAAWNRFRHSASSGFTFVEAVGLAYGPRLLADSLGWSRPTVDPRCAGLNAAEHARRLPRLDSAVPSEERVALAASILRGMSLTRDFAPLVLLVGHGSVTANNPHAAAYDCGACCGQTGDVNARVVAALLNEAEVRTGLAGHGIHVPDTTRFVPALHDTTTDEVVLLDVDALPASHTRSVANLRRHLAEAGAQTRLRRAPGLGLTERDPARLRRLMERRARDWAQVRPEWGLAGNACFIAAPRERTRHLDLAGRAFLHEYRWQEDAGFAVLGLILSAPVVVAHWINFQYYASTVDNRRLGSGDKVLHNIVGSSIGVFEGNGGDLRIGLPRQALHDGSAAVHEPLRLGVFVEAPREALLAAVEQHTVVRDLVANEWIHLYRIAEDGSTEPVRVARVAS